MSKRQYPVPRRYSDYGYCAGIVKGKIIAEQREVANFERLAKLCNERSEALQRFMQYIESVMREPFPALYHAMEKELFEIWKRFGNKPVPHANQQIESFLRNSTDKDAEAALKVWLVAYPNFK